MVRAGTPEDCEVWMGACAKICGAAEQIGCRALVLSAFGCGAFENPAPVGAAAYRDALQEKENQRHFRVVAFAVFHAGYGPNNWAESNAAWSDDWAAANPAAMPAWAGVVACSTNASEAVGAPAATQFAILAMTSERSCDSTASELGAVWPSVFIAINRNVNRRVVRDQAIMQERQQIVIIVVRHLRHG